MRWCCLLFGRVGVSFDSYGNGPFWDRYMNRTVLHMRAVLLHVQVLCIFEWFWIEYKKHDVSRAARFVCCRDCCDLARRRGLVTSVGYQLAAEGELCLSDISLTTRIAMNMPAFHDYVTRLPQHLIVAILVYHIV